MTTTAGHTNPEPAVESTGTLATVRSVFSLLLSYGLLLLANGLFGTLIGVRSQIEGFGTEVVGLIMAAYFLGLCRVLCVPPRSLPPSGTYVRSPPLLR